MSLYAVPADEIPALSLTGRNIVLDLDHTLVSTSENGMTDFQQLGLTTGSDPRLLSLRNRAYQVVLDDVGSKRGTGTRADYWGMSRPHLEEFLVFCFSYFRLVSVWSAGVPDYVDALVARLFANVRRPHYVFTRDDCEGEVKPLSRIRRTDPRTQELLRPDNTLVLDDKLSTFADNPANGVLIPPYDPPFTVNGLSTEDIALLQFKSWLLQPEVARAPDVRSLEKNQIFSTPLGRFSRPVPLSFR